MHSGAFCEDELAVDSDSMFAFRRDTPLGKRRRMRETLAEMYPTMLPVVCGSQKLEFSKTRFLVDASLSFDEFVASCRKFVVHTHDGTAVFCFTEERSALVPSGHTIGTVTETYASPRDGFLYLVFCEESVFG